MYQKVRRFTIWNGKSINFFVIYLVKIEIIWFIKLWAETYFTMEGAWSYFMTEGMGYEVSEKYERIETTDR